MNSFMATTLQNASVVVESRDLDLAAEIRQFVAEIDDEYLSNDYHKILDIAGKGMLTWYTIAERKPWGLTAAPAGANTNM